MPEPRLNRKHGFLAVVLAGIIGMLAGLGSYTFTYAHGLSYFSNNPQACVNCHIMRPHYDGWLKSPHHAVATCNDCHTPDSFIAKYLSKAENGFWHSKGFTLQDFHEPIMIRPINSAVLQNNCVRCHQELLSGLNAHAGDAQKMLDCVSCHREVGHGPVR